MSEKKEIKAEVHNSREVIHSHSAGLASHHTVKSHPDVVGQATRGREIEHRGYILGEKKKVTYSSDTRITLSGNNPPPPEE